MLTFLFTDIEGSSEKWEKFGNEMGKALTIHDAILKEQIEKYNGRIFKHTGDGVLAVFENSNPVECALQLQKCFQNQNWGNIGELRIRIALHSGEAEKRDDDFFGPTVNRTARILNAGWGGQILLTREVINLYKLPQNTNLQDLGVHLLKDLTESQQIFSLLHPDLRITEFPPLRTLSGHPHNLPTQLTPFIGRVNEIIEITKLLQDPSCRLITLTGIGGTGKTRLALQAGAEQIEKFGSGVFFIPLAPLSSPDFIVPTIAESLNFSFYSNENPEKQLTNYLKEKAMLLIMDNFEHLIEGAGIVAGILKHAPKVKILATSRERLNLLGEWVFQVEGMRVPEAVEIDIEKYSSVQLFLQSARRMQPSYIPKDDDKSWIARICQLVDGLPLGIELASSWIRMLPTQEIAKEVERSFDFLTTQLRDVSERHRGLRVVFEYSYNLLTEEEKGILMKLSVFHGGFTRDSAEKVAETSFLLLSSLVDKSLIRISPSGRYEIHEVIRQFAEEKMNENLEKKEKARKLHSEYFAMFVNKREEGLIGENQITVISKIAEEIENIRIGFDYAIEKIDETIIDKYINCLFQFYDVRGWFIEGANTFEKVVSRLKGKKTSTEDEKNRINVVLGKVISREGAFLFRLGKCHEAKDLLYESLSILRDAGDKKEIVFTLCFLSDTMRILGEYSEAQNVLKESIDISKQIDDEYLLALALNNSGNLETALGDYHKAEMLFNESLTIRKKISNIKGIAGSLMNLGTIYFYIDEHNKSNEFYKEALEIFEKLGDRRGIAISLNNLGGFETIIGNYEDGEKLFNKSLEISKEIGDQTFISRALNNLGQSATFTGNYEKAESYLIESNKINKESGDKRGISLTLTNLANVYSNKGDLDKAKMLCIESLEISREIDNLRSISNSLIELGNLYIESGEYEKAKEYLQESYQLCNEMGYKSLIAGCSKFLGVISYKQGEYKNAWLHIIKALNINIETQVIYDVLMTLSKIAELIKIEGKREKALEILSFILNHPASLKNTQDETKELLSELEAELPIKTVADALKKGKEKTLENIVQEINEMKSKE